MVHAPELLGYEQYTPFPAACQWQSERPPPVAGAFAGLFMALGSAACVGKTGLDGPVCLVLSFAGLPLSLRLILLTASAYVSRSRKEDRPWRAAQRVCLGATGPILAEGHAKTGKRRPPHFLACLSPFGFAPTVIYRAHPSLWTSEGRPALAAAHRVCLGGRRPPFWRKGTPKTGKRRPPHFSVCLSPFGLAPTVIYRAHPSLWTSAGKTRWWGSRCGGRARRGCRWRPRTPSRARRSRRRG